MNRRTSIGIIGFGFATVSAISIFKFFRPPRPADLEMLGTNKSLIAELAETIIPRTDTPGSKDAKVEEFIISFITECTGEQNQNLFMNGLLDLKDYTLDTYKSSFESCTQDQKIKILGHFEQQAESRFEIVNKIRNKFLGRPFFVQLKELTVIGYCTSYLGATEGLAYDYIPSSYQPCIKLLPNQKSWATK
ncbi:hypothetical protein HDC92_000039 [Pedobacter sp. AK017]|uniref:gluconate 2-dehydrogenase subunit 3 family protein n=1 Tax=Pedobacter sp. AK017 TaxID=2723073 RepID=UPI00161C604E|nr:gluconate 2-dehydrogenase subunit 3 family protein [Pedobacter sp. AK017]MBB5436375.1 hypothetical protein [Pedobacter sp. AK017]